MIWWRGNWEGEDPVNPPGKHQRQVQRRRHRRRAQETYILDGQSTDHSPTRAADTEATCIEQESCTVTAANGTIRRKRNLQRTDEEEQADRAAIEIVNLVEQDAQHSARSLTGPSTPPDMHTPSPSRDMSAMLRSAGTEQEEEEAAIPEWVITKSREMNREVTPPAQLFFRAQGERQYGDCGPTAVIVTLY